MRSPTGLHTTITYFRNGGLNSMVSFLRERIVPLLCNTGIAGLDDCQYVVTVNISFIAPTLSQIYIVFISIRIQFQSSKQTSSYLPYNIPYTSQFFLVSISLVYLSILSKPLSHSLPDTIYLSPKSRLQSSR